MSDRPLARSFIDESGQRSSSANSSPYFVLSAVTLPAARQPEATAWLADLRSNLNRKPTDLLHWIKYPQHGHRLHASTKLGAAGFALVTSVVVSKRHLVVPKKFTQDHAYMFAFRMLLERLSWLAAEKEMDLEYVLGHVRGFKLSTLRQYEAALRGESSSTCKINWDHLCGNGSLARPETEELLQIADIAASATGAAFNPDKFGYTEQRYLTSMRPRIWCPPRRNLTSYGLKMHPWREDVRAAHPWVAAL